MVASLTKGTRHRLQENLVLKMSPFLVSMLPKIVPIYIYMYGAYIYIYIYLSISLSLSLSLYIYMCVYTAYTTLKRVLEFQVARGFL